MSGGRGPVAQPQAVPMLESSQADAGGEAKRHQRLPSSKHISGVSTQSSKRVSDTRFIFARSVAACGLWIGGGA